MNEIYQMQLKVECDTGKARNWIVKNIQNGTYESTFIDKNGMFTASQAGCFDVYATLGFDAVSNTVRLDVAKICSSISAPTPNSSKPIYISNVKCSDFSRWNYAQAYYIA